MRFSSVFQLPLIRTAAVPKAPARAEEPVSTYYSGYDSQFPPTDFSQLPEELDQRVRLVGEWQLGMD
jgi:hypothetical protein